MGHGKNSKIDKRRAYVYSGLQSIPSSPQRATTPMVLTLPKGIGLNFAQNVIMIIKNHQLKKCFWIISKRRKKLWANNILVNIQFSPSKLSGSYRLSLLAKNQLYFVKFVKFVKKCQVCTYFQSEVFKSKIVGIFHIFFQYRINVQEHIFCKKHLSVTSIVEPLYY